MAGQKIMQTADQKFQDELKILKELKRVQFFEKIKPLGPRKGSFVFSKHPLQNCAELGEHVYVLLTDKIEDTEFLWIPHFEELLEVARAQNISFSLITDFIHRKRFADGKEKFGVYQLLLERFR